MHTAGHLLYQKHVNRTELALSGVGPDSPAVDEADVAVYRPFKNGHSYTTLINFKDTAQKLA